MSDIPPPVSDQPVLQLQDVEQSYGWSTVLRGVSIQVRRGEIAAVLGAKGAGKTTLLQTISGMQSPQAGSTVFKGENIAGVDPSQMVEQGLSHVAHGRAVFTHLSADDNLRVGAYTRTDDQGVAKDMDAMYRYFPVLRNCANRPAGALSAYPQLLLAVACALMANPDLLLLDDPVKGLTPVQSAEFMDRVVQINRERGIAMLVTEDGNGSHALSIADYGYVLDKGRIVLEGTAATLREKIRFAAQGMPARRLQETM